MPPNGIIGWTPPWELIHTVPASSRAATARAACRVAAPHRGAQADVEAVRHGDGVLDVAVADDGERGAELLLGDQRVVVVDVGHQVVG